MSLKWLPKDLGCFNTNMSDMSIADLPGDPGYNDLSAFRDTHDGTWRCIVRLFGINHECGGWPTEGEARLAGVRLAKKRLEFILRAAAKDLEAVNGEE